MEYYKLIADTFSRYRFHLNSLIKSFDEDNINKNTEVINIQTYIDILDKTEELSLINKKSEEFTLVYMIEELYYKLLFKLKKYIEEKDNNIYISNTKNLYNVSDQILIIKDIKLIYVEIEKNIVNIINNVSTINIKIITNENSKYKDNLIQYLYDLLAFAEEYSGKNKAKLYMRKRELFSVYFNLISQYIIDINDNYYIDIKLLNLSLSFNNLYLINDVYNYTPETEFISLNMFAKLYFKEEGNYKNIRELMKVVIDKLNGKTVDKYNTGKLVNYVYDYKIIDSCTIGTSAYYYYSFGNMSNIKVNENLDAKIEQLLTGKAQREKIGNVYNYSIDTSLLSNTQTIKNMGCSMKQKPFNINEYKEKIEYKTVEEFIERFKYTKNNTFYIEEAKIESINLYRILLNKNAIKKNRYYIKKRISSIQPIKTEEEINNIIDNNIIKNQILTNDLKQIDSYLIKTKFLVMFLDELKIYIGADLTQPNIIKVCKEIPRKNINIYVSSLLEAITSMYSKDINNNLYINKFKMSISPAVYKVAEKIKKEYCKHGISYNSLSEYTYKSIIEKRMSDAIDNLGLSNIFTSINVNEKIFNLNNYEDRKS